MFESLLPFAGKAILIFLAALGATIGLKIAIKFDINTWIQQRRERKLAKLRMLCPHAELQLLEGGSAQVIPWFHKPPMTAAYICDRCGSHAYNHHELTRLSQFYLENPDAYIERVQAFDKQFKKVYGK